MSYLERWRVLRCKRVDDYLKHTTSFPKHGWRCVIAWWLTVELSLQWLLTMWLQIEAAAWIQKGVQLRFSPAKQTDSFHWPDLSPANSAFTWRKRPLWVSVKAETHKQMSTEGSHSKGLARHLEGDFWWSLGFPNLQISPFLVTSVYPISLGPVIPKQLM